jgi:hypothetical protein
MDPATRQDALMATAPSANDLTRQQLDELDALLQRMLTLPNAAPDVNAYTPAPVNRRPEPPPLAVFPRPEPFPAPVMPLPEPSVPVEVRTTVIPAPPAEPRTPPPPTAPSINAPNSVPVVLWPLTAFNWSIDTVLGSLGPPGRFLRSGFGKNLLGLAGLLLLAYTTAHIASELGWLSLPTPLPWPK